MILKKARKLKYLRKKKKKVLTNYLSLFINYNLIEIEHTNKKKGT
jgi:hypothetical protein